MFVGLDAVRDTALIVDIRDPMNPQLLTTISLDAGFATYDLFYHKGWLYFSHGLCGCFAVLDLRGYDPDNAPARITTAKWWVELGRGPIRSVRAQGDRLYVTGMFKLHVFDISNIANEEPRLMGSTDGIRMNSAWPTDDGRFIAVCEDTVESGLKLFEVAEDGGKAILTLRDEFISTRGAAFYPVILGNRIYCSWQTGGCQVFEIDRDAGKLIHVGSLRTRFAWGIYPLLGPNRIVLSDRVSGLYILAATIPADMNCDGFIDLTDVEGFLLALIDPDEYEAQNPDCDIEAADVNQDGSIDLVDVEPFVQALLGG